MYNIVKFAAAAAAALVLASCSDSGIKINVAEKSYETENAQIQARIPRFEYAQNQEFADEVSGRYDTMVMSLLDEFIARTQDNEKKSEFKIDTDVKFNNGRLVSVVCEGETYSGGAHGEKFRISRTADFETGAELSLADVFSDEEWKKAVNVKMEQLAQSGEGEYKDLWEKPSTDLLKEENFYINEDGIVFYFPPYELSYYRRGFVEFEFGYDELSGFLKDEFKNGIRY